MKLRSRNACQGGMLVITIVICALVGIMFVGLPVNGLHSIQVHGGTMDLHDDEALRGETNRGRFLADSWEETKFAPSWEEL